MKLKHTITLLFFCLPAILFAQVKQQSFYQVTVYHFDNQEQESSIDGYLKNAYLPALHRKGIKNIGVFKPIGNDTLQDKRIYLLVPLKSPQQFAELPDLLTDIRLNADGRVYLEAGAKKPPYKRMESIFLKAFPDMPHMNIPSLKNDISKRVYELRSYEGPTEKMYSRKVEMFNKGGEITLFEKLDFNAVFYASVISGSRMPNLMYMTTFEDMASRDAHWKAFFASDKWKEISAMDYYKNTVSKSEIILLHPVSYSEI